MAGRGRVDDDQVGRATFFQRLDLAEHEDVLHARHRGRDDVERAGRREPLRDAPHPVGLEVFEERGVGREEPGPDPVGEVGFVVAERVDAEHRGQPRFALDLDNQHPETGARRGDRERGCHGCLPDAALARDDHDVGGGAELRNLHLLHATRALMPTSAARRIRMLLALVARRARWCVGVARGRPGRHRRRAERHRRRTGRRAARPSERRARGEFGASGGEERLHGARHPARGNRRGRRERRQARRHRGERDGPDRRVDRAFRRGRARRERAARAAARRSSSVAPGAGIGPAAPAAVRRARRPAARRGRARGAGRAGRERPEHRQRRTRSWTAGCRRARRTASGS